MNPSSFEIQLNGYSILIEQNENMKSSVRTYFDVPLIAIQKNDRVE